MRVDPARLVELARASEEACADLDADWQDAIDSRSRACQGLGNAAAAPTVVQSYGAALGAADEALGSLVRALAAGADAVLDAARDATTADEVVAGHLRRPCGHGGGHEGASGLDGGGR